MHTRGENARPEDEVMRRLPSTGAGARGRCCFSRKYWGRVVDK